LGAISGYGAGALILDSLGWRWAFYLNMPIAAAGLAIVLTVMPASRERLQPPSRDMALEAVTLLLGAGGLLAGLSLTAGREAGWLGLSLAALVPILVWTRSEPGRAAIDRLRVPSVRQPHVSLLLEAFAFGGATFALPFLLGAGEAHASRSVGLLLLVLPLASICGSAFGGVLADRATARLSAVLGAAVLAIGLAIAARANSAWDLPDFLWAVVLAGAGAGCFSGANQALAMTAAAPGEAASTGASTNVARQLGFAIGPATVTAIWAAQDYATDGLSQAMALAAGASVAAAVALLPPARPPHTTGMNQRKERP
jgi:predicted MFS family arabinose efflux permease